MVAKCVDNVSIVVEDLDRVLQFFLDLGLEITGSQYMQNEWLNILHQCDDVRAVVLMLSCPSGLARVQLFYYENPPSPPAPPRGPINSLGMRRISFLVDDVDEARKVALAAGAVPLGPVTQLDDDGYKTCFVIGPENIAIMFLEELPLSRGRFFDN